MNTLESTPTPQFPHLPYLDELRPAMSLARGPITSLVALGSGDMNWVLYAPEQDLVFRIPRITFRDEKVSRWRRRMYDDALSFGVSLQAELGDALVPPPVPIPRIVDLGFNSDALDISFVAMEKAQGDHIDEATAERSFSPLERRRFGETVAECMAWLAATIPLGEDWNNLVHLEYGARESSHIYWNDRFRWIREGYNDGLLAGWLDIERFPSLAEALYRLHAEVGQQRKDGEFTERIVGHNDYRPGNYLFGCGSEGHKVATGWIDFDTARPTTPAREMRYIWLLGQEAVRAAITRYAVLTGETVKSEAILFWLKVQMVGGALYNIAEGRTIPKKQGDYIKRLHPDLSWAEFSE